MEINELNNKLGQILENIEKIDKIEDEINKAQETIWDRLDNNMDEIPVADIVLPHLDELTIDDLAKIIWDYQNDDHSILPSGWDANNGAYPVKIAEALSKTRVHEEITDLWNIYYCNRDPQIFKDAATFWENYMIENPEKAFDGIDMLADGPEYPAAVYNDLEENHPKLVKHLLAYHEKTNPKGYKELIKYMANN